MSHDPTSFDLIPTGAAVGVEASRHGVAADLKWQQITSEMLDSLLPYQKTILGLFAISAQTGLDPSPSLASLGCELIGRPGYDLIRLANQLPSEPDRLSVLESYPRLVPAEALVFLRLAQEDGMLPYVWKLIRTRLPRTSRPWIVGGPSPWGLLFKSAFILAIVGFICFKIVPELQKILQEFGAEDSPVFVLLFHVLGWTFQMLGGLVLLIILILAIGLVLWFVRALLGGGWRRGKPLAAVTRNRFVASLTQATDSLSAGLDRLVRLEGLKRRFSRIHKTFRQVQEGQDPWKALSNQKYISRADAALVSSVSPETQAWLLRWSALNLERRHHTRWVVGRRLGWIAVQALLIFAVFITATFVIGSLIEIMNGLMEHES